MFSRLIFFSFILKESNLFIDSLTVVTLQVFNHFNQRLLSFTMIVNITNY